MAQGVKLAVVGSSLLLDYPSIQARIELEIERVNPSVLILVPNQRFNAFIKEIVKKNSIHMDELKPARPSWLGKDKQSRRKFLLRNLYANYIVERADAVILFGKKEAAGLTYKAVEKLAKQREIPVYEWWFD